MLVIYLLHKLDGYLLVGYLVS